MIKIRKETGKIENCGEMPCFLIEIDKRRHVMMFGDVPYLYIDHIFSFEDVKRDFKSSLADIVPYMVGNSLYLLIENDKVKEISVDYYCHSRFYYSELEEYIYISERWKDVPHKDNGFNLFELIYFLNWDSTINGDTFFDELKYRKLLRQNRLPKQ